jgi:hypothetical protein
MLDAERQIRFLYSPVFFIASLFVGIRLRSVLQTSAIAMSLSWVVLVALWVVVAICETARLQPLRLECGRIFKLNLICAHCELPRS